MCSIPVDNLYRVFILVISCFIDPFGSVIIFVWPWSCVCFQKGQKDFQCMSGALWSCAVFAFNSFYEILMVYGVDFISGSVLYRAGFYVIHLTWSVLYFNCVNVIFHDFEPFFLIGYAY